MTEHQQGTKSGNTAAAVAPAWSVAVLTHTAVNDWAAVKRNLLLKADKCKC